VNIVNGNGFTNVGMTSSRKEIELA